MVYSFTLTIDLTGFAWPEVEIFPGGIVISLGIFHLLIMNVDQVMERRQLERLE